MGAYQDYINVIRVDLGDNIVPDLGGTLMSQNASNFASVIGQKVRGGSFPLQTLAQLADIPLEILEEGMEVRVLETKTKYFLNKLPTEVISEITDYNLSDYWLPVAGSNNETESPAIELESQFAPNYDGKRPLFEPKDITSEAYQAGYATTDGFTSLDSSQLIWADDFDSSNGHIWIRQRLSNEDDWGIPVKIYGEGYETGQYISNIFKWVLKTDPAPTAPPSTSGGVSNIEPSGWDNAPDNFPDTDYTTSVLTYDLYRSTAVISAYNKLKTNWSVPIKISTDPFLTRYGNTPGSIDFFNEDFWRPNYTPGLDTHMASRKLISGVSGEVSAVYGDWTVIKIDNESGEYPDFIYKAFPIGTPPELADKPTSETGMGGTAPNDAVDAPFDVADNELLYASKSIKFFDGSLKTPWSTWFRFDGLDTIQSVIEPLTADVFKKKVDGVVTPSTIQLKPNLYRGNTIITTGLTIEWFRGGSQVIGSTPDHTIDGSTFVLTINPDGVTDVQDYELRITFEEVAYKSYITIVDVTDGVKYSAQINSPSGIIYKNSEGSKNFSASFYINGVEDNDNATFAWTLDGQTISDPNNTPITGDQINGQAILKLTATFKNTEYVDVLTLTDLIDGVATIRVYHESDTNPPDFDSDLTLAQIIALDSGWTTDYVGAVWMREFDTATSLWGGETRIKGEKGSNNSGFLRNAFKNSISRPAAASLTADLLPQGSGWTDAPTDQATNESTWLTTRFFTKNPDTVETNLIQENWDAVNEWSEPVRLIKPAASVAATDGVDGWTPLLAAEVIDDNHKYIKVTSWTGGEGTPPDSPVYLGDGSLVSDINQAVNFGSENIRPQYYAQSRLGDGYVTTEITMTEAQGFIEVGSLLVQNTWNQKRYFRIDASIGVSNDDQPDHFYAVLTRQVGESSNPVQVDHDSVSTDFTSTSNAYKAKLRCTHVIEIPANASRLYKFSIEQIGGGGGRRDNEAFITAIGL